MHRFIIFVILWVTYTNVCCNDPWQESLASKLNSLVIDDEEIVYDVAKNRSIRSARTKLPKIFDTFTNDLDEGNNFETGRGKMKKVLFSFGTKFMGLIPMFVGGIGLLAMKAVVVSKIALLFAIVGILQLFFFKRCAQRMAPQYSSRGDYLSHGFN